MNDRKKQLLDVFVNATDLLDERVDLIESILEMVALTPSLTVELSPKDIQSLLTQVRHGEPVVEFDIVNSKDREQISSIKINFAINTKYHEIIIRNNLEKKQSDILYSLQKSHILKWLDKQRKANKDKVSYLQHYRNGDIFKINQTYNNKISKAHHPILGLNKRQGRLYWYDLSEIKDYALLFLANWSIAIDPESVYQMQAPKSDVLSLPHQKEENVVPQKIVDVNGREFAPQQKVHLK